MSEQPRLLFCCFDVLPGPNGLSRRITEYLKGLADRFQVVVLSTKTPDHSHIERYHGARLLRVPVGAGDLQSRIQAFDRAVRRQLESEEYVLAHFFDPFGGYALCDSRAQYGFRLVYDAQSFPSQELKYTNPTLEGERRFLSKVRRQELYCLMNADAVVCGSEATRDWVLSLGAPPVSLHVFRQPIDLGPFTEATVGKPDGSPMKLLHLGSQLPYQGLETLLRAMQLALRQADLRLSVVGPKVPEGQAPYDELVAELKLTGKVEFLDGVKHDELPKTLAACDVGMLTLDESDRNRAQGGPLAKVGEYLAAGRPIVASDLPVVRELVPESARLLFPPNDFKALAEILVQLAGDADKRIELGAKAREAAERFDASGVRGKLLDLYENLSTRGKATGPAESGEITQLRATGSSDTGRVVARAGADERPPGETLDDEAPVVVGQSIEVKEQPEDRARAAVTEPGMAAPIGGPPEPTPIVKSKRKKKGTTDEHTPIRPAPESPVEPTPITSARSRRVISKSGKAVPPPPKTPPPPPVTELPAEPRTAPVAAFRGPGAPVPEWPESEPAELTPVWTPPLSDGPSAPEPPPPPPAPAAPADAPPVRIRRTTEGKGVRSPLLPPLEPVVTVENPVPEQLPARIKRTSENKGIRSPLLPPIASPPPPPPEAFVALPPAPPPPPASSEPSVVVELDAGLPKIKRGEDARTVRPTDRIPILTPATGIPVVKVTPLGEPPSFDLPKIKRSVPEHGRVTEQIPVLTPRPPLGAGPPTPSATFMPPVLSELPPPPLPPPPQLVSESATIPVPVVRAKKPEDEPEEISSDEIDSVEEEAARPPETANEKNPWVQQLLFGYCPPEAVPFERPAPPTTFPGRETK